MANPVSLGLILIWTGMIIALLVSVGTAVAFTNGTEMIRILVFILGSTVLEIIGAIQIQRSSMRISKLINTFEAMLFGVGVRHVTVMTPEGLKVPTQRRLDGKVWLDNKWIGVPTGYTVKPQ
jgi:hypothetical protein